MIKNLLDDKDGPPAESASSERTTKKEPAVMGLFDSVDEPVGSPGRPLVPSADTGVSAAETARRSGMAFSLGVAFFSSVLFLLILGWGADLLFGSAPWGLVVGIVIGALIGFYQIFRISAQIFKS
jgi:hypothetical protein